MTQDPRAQEAAAERSGIEFELNERLRIDEFISAYWPFGHASPPTHAQEDWIGSTIAIHNAILAHPKGWGVTTVRRALAAMFMDPLLEDERPDDARTQYLIDWLDRQELLGEHCFTFPDGDTYWATGYDPGGA